VVTLRHHGLPAEEQEMHQQGWEFYLERLIIAAAGGDAGPHVKPGQ
jgi:hypothetical protein